MLKISFQKLLPLFTVIFLGFFGYALTLTLFIPLLMDQTFPILPAETSVAVRTTLSGFLLAMYPLGQFLGSPVIGNLSDHFGRKKVLVFSLILCLFGFISMAFSIAFHQLTLLFISAFLTGLCESNMAISQTIIADSSSDPAEKTKFIGYAYSACSLGFIAGPLVGGLAGSALSYSAPFWVTAIGIVFLITWIFCNLNDSSMPDAKTPVHILKSLTAIKSIFNRKEFYKIYFINFFIFFAVQGLYRVAPMYALDTWKPSLSTYSLLIAYVSFICFIANLLLLGRLTQWFSTQKLLSGLLFIGGLLVILIALPSYFGWIWLVYGLAVIPTVMALPVSTAWLAQQARADEQGQVLGNNQALLVLGESTSAAIGGLIAAIYISLPVVMMGVILLIAGVMVKKFNVRKQ
ncbi:MAG: tetA 2 [Gammaproteobacteria bacterium]|jgi:DHA1 family tetracycline resistance protein-like MFS transporter|nr:tetA 2 [Gammaproteobacteria bacterium]